MLPTINDVSDTSFWVAYYRALETERADALFRDPLARILIGDRGKTISESMGSMARYTQWSVVARTVIIDRFIQEQIDAGVDAIINLGSGLDTRPYRMSFPDGFEWVEVDHSNIIQHKSSLLSNQKPNCRLTRVALDLGNREDRREFFRTIVPNAKKVMILTEGVVVYLTPEHVAELSEDLQNQERFKLWITEYFDRRVYKYLQTTVRKAKMKNAPFQFYPDDWMSFFAKRGWVENERRYSGDIAAEFKRSQPMPWFVRLLMPVLPPSVKKQSREMAGYVLFQKADLRV
jgi:methyltransferase (TIGR00027 family)